MSKNSDFFNDSPKSHLTHKINIFKFKFTKWWLQIELFYESIQTNGVFAPWTSDRDESFAVFSGTPRRGATRQWLIALTTLRRVCLTLQHPVMVGPRFLLKVRVPERGPAFDREIFLAFLVKYHAASGTLEFDSAVPCAALTWCEDSAGVEKYVGNNHWR